MFLYLPWSLVEVQCDTVPAGPVVIHKSPFGPGTIAHPTHRELTPKQRLQPTAITSVDAQLKALTDLSITLVRPPHLHRGV